MEDIIMQLKNFTMFTGAVFVGGEILAYYLKNRVNQVGKLATAHLITKNDIKDIIGTNGLIFSEDIQFQEKFDYEGSVILGPTGSGKSTSFFFPNLLTNSLRGSIIITDPKGELFEKTSLFQQKVCKRKVYKFSPFQATSSAKYNLLTNCKDSTEVSELASMLLFNGALSIELATGKKTGGAEWLLMCEPLLTAALLYARELGYPYNNVEFAFKLLITLTTEQLNSLFSNSQNQDCINQWNMFKVVCGADKTESSIKITLSSNMKLWMDNKINAVTNENSFDIEKFRTEESILYVCYPENKASYLAPLIAPFFSQCMAKLIDYYNDESLPVTMLFDEFANIGMLNNMATNVSTIRSRKISMNICLQGISQLSQIYGISNLKTILNNLKTKIILPSLSDEDTLKYVSNLCGDKEITICNKNVNKQSTSQSFSKTKVKLFENNELRCLEDNQMLLITSNKQPILTTQNRYYNNNSYMKNIYDTPATISKSNNNTKINIEKEIKKIELKLAEKEEVSDVSDGLFKRKSKYQTKSR